MGSQVRKFSEDQKTRSSPVSLNMAHHGVLGPRSRICSKSVDGPGQAQRSAMTLPQQRRVLEASSFSLGPVPPHDPALI